MRIIAIFSMLFLLLTNAQAQERLARLKKAERLYSNEQYTDAAKEYEKLLKSRSAVALMGIDPKANLADCYRRLGRSTESERLFSEVLDSIVDRPEVYLYYGEVLMQNGKYDYAIELFNKYTDLRPEDPTSAQFIQQCRAIQEIRPVYDKVYFVTQDKANTYKTDEFGLAYFGAGIVFTSDRIIKGSVASETNQERDYLSMYYSQIGANGELEKPIYFSKKLNRGTQHDGPATFSRNATKILFSRSTKSSADAEMQSLEIVESNLEDGQWTTPEPLPFMIEGKLFSHPCLSPDGTQLYFMSDMPGGHGGTDIWVSTYKFNRWSNPKNLGPSVNTDKNEGYPFFHIDGSLYFASQGHFGYGGFDLYRVKPLGNGIDWQEPENLGQPFNSAKDDTYFLFDDYQTTGFVASNRRGDDNIYLFKIEGAEPKDLPFGTPQRDTVELPDPVEVELVKGFSVNNNPDNTNENPADNTNNPKDPDEVDVDQLLEQYKNQNPNNNNNPDNNPDTDPNNENPNNNPDTDNNNNPDPNPNNNNPDPDPYPNNNTGDPSVIPLVENNPPDPNIQLTIQLKVIDSKANASLVSAEVIVKNEFTTETQNFTTSSNGIVELQLQPNQKYQIQASKDGYYNGALPITTMGAKTSQTVDATLPLIKK